MKKYQCMKCKFQMIRNTFICDRCFGRLWRNDKNAKIRQGEKIVRQRISEIDKDNHTSISPYWDHAYATQPLQQDAQDGEIIEDNRANPDNIDFYHPNYRRLRENKHELKRLLHEAIDHLTYKEQMIMRMYLQGKSQAKIAHDLYIPQQTVSWKIQQITEYLATQLGNKDVN